MDRDFAFYVDEDGITGWSIGPVQINENGSVDMSDVKIKSVGSTAQRLKAGTTWMNQRVEFLTTLFGKQYYWLRDGDGTVYLAKVGKDGLPDLS